MNQESLIEKVEQTLDGDGTLEERCSRALETIAREFGAITATLHRADLSSRLLHMVASLGIPDHLKPVTAAIPFGKGMAGLCAERGEPVTVCNLQTDDSGVAKPAAKETRVEGAIVIPIFSKREGRVIGTLGIGKPEEHEYTETERNLLLECASCFSSHLEPNA